MSEAQSQVLGQGPAEAVAPIPCRYCGAPVVRTFIDLGMSPLCESFVPLDRLDAMEPFFPLHVRICDSCRLIQLPALVPREEIFTRYAYFSSYSTSWVEHARTLVETCLRRFHLGPDDFVIEIASNDGYLLQHFLGTGIPILGIDPAVNVSEAAAQRGVPTLVTFFGRETAERLLGEDKLASLVIANNVLAQVPDVNDFLAAVKIILRPEGSAIFEFPHVLRLLEGVQYDTIYHEHFSYFSCRTLVQILRAHGLDAYDVEELRTHGGSLRLYVQHIGGPHATMSTVRKLLADEDAKGVDAPGRHERFAKTVEASKWALLDLLIRLRREGKQVIGYGAPGKANTLLNYCGIRTDLLEYVVDRNPYKQGRFTPGTHIPIRPPELIAATRPDFVVVLAWNLLEEIAQQLSYISAWEGKLIVPIPEPKIVEPLGRLCDMSSNREQDAPDERQVCKG